MDTGRCVAGSKSRSSAPSARILPCSRVSFSMRTEYNKDKSSAEGRSESQSPQRVAESYAAADRIEALEITACRIAATSSDGQQSAAPAFIVSTQSLSSGER